MIAQKIFDLIREKLIDVEVINADLEWLGARGHLPEKLSDVIEDPS